MNNVQWVKDQYHYSYLGMLCCFLYLIIGSFGDMVLSDKSHYVITIGVGYCFWIYLSLKFMSNFDISRKNILFDYYLVFSLFCASGTFSFDRFVAENPHMDFSLFVFGIFTACVSITSFFFMRKQP